MFRATVCPSSGENYCIYATLVFVNLIFVVPCIMLNSEINPTRCNNCVYSSQWQAIAKNKRNCCILLDLFHYMVFATLRWRLVCRPDAIQT